MNTTMTPNPQEQKRIKVLIEHLTGNRSVTQVAALLECTPRHMYRLKALYGGCNQRHMRNVLEERGSIKVSPSSVRRILQAEGVWVLRPSKRPKHRLRRPRYQQEGQLIQIDASPHLFFLRSKKS